MNTDPRANPIRGRRRWGYRFDKRHFMLRHVLFTALMIATTAPAGAAESEVQPGQYVLDGDSGTLTIRKNEQNRLTFEIDTTGGNGHVCNVSGVISAGVGRGGSLNADESGPKCEISFSAGASTVEVRPITEEACRYYCGMRAIFEGTYRIPPAGCTSEGREARRGQFLRLYRARQFAQAKETLQNLMTQCRNYMSWIEIDKVRNDLALAQYHHGELHQCLTTLNETLAGKVKNEEELKSGHGEAYLPPTDFDSYIDVAKSTWFNKALCTKAMSKRR